MKKEFFDVISNWHQEQKKLLIANKTTRAEVLNLGNLSAIVETKEDVANSLSEFLNEDISPINISWGIPLTHFPCQNKLKVGCGFVYTLPNLGWILIWHGEDKVMFLDKNLFRIEPCHPQKVTTLIEKTKKILLAIAIFLVSYLIICMLK